VKKVRYFLEAALLRCLFVFFSVLPAQRASNIGGWIGRNIGPRLAASRKARRNLERAIPALQDHAYEDIICGMWDNLGRLIAEYPHLETIAKERTVIDGIENLKPYIKGERQAIFIGGHFANFEIPAVCAFLQCGLAIDSTYRAPNNPYVHALLNAIRSVDGELQAHAKSQAGGRGLMKAIKQGRNAGILIDQKYNEGVDVPFMGRSAMTNPVFVQLAQKYDCDIVPIRTIRDADCRFRFIVDSPIEYGAGDAIESVIEKAHMVLEKWVLEHPGQWLWLHRRWKD